MINLHNVSIKLVKIFDILHLLMAEFQQHSLFCDVNRRSTGVKYSSESTSEKTSLIQSLQVGMIITYMHLNYLQLLLLITNTKQKQKQQTQLIDNTTDNKI